MIFSLTRLFEHGNVRWWVEAFRWNKQGLWHRSHCLQMDILVLGWACICSWSQANVCMPWANIQLAFRVKVYVLSHIGIGRLTTRHRWNPGAGVGEWTKSLKTRDQPYPLIHCSDWRKFRSLEIPVYTHEKDMKYSRLHVQWCRLPTPAPVNKSDSTGIWKRERDDTLGETQRKFWKKKKKEEEPRSQIGTGDGIKVTGGNIPQRWRIRRFGWHVTICGLCSG